MNKTGRDNPAGFLIRMKCIIQYSKRVILLLSPVFRLRCIRMTRVIIPDLLHIHGHCIHHTHQFQRVPEKTPFDILIGNIPDNAHHIVSSRYPYQSKKIIPISRIDVNLFNTAI